MRQSKGEWAGMAIVFVLACMVGPCSQANAEPATDPVNAELADVARRAIADDHYHYCMRYADESNMEYLQPHCRNSGLAKAASFTDLEAIAEFETMLLLWAEGAELRR